MIETVFPTIMYILGSILLVFLIVLVMKLIYTVDKTNLILDDVEKKVKTLDGFFNAIDTATTTITSISDTVFDKVYSLFSKFIRKKNVRNKEEEYFNE